VGLNSLTMVPSKLKMGSGIKENGYQQLQMGIYEGSKVGIN